MSLILFIAILKVYDFIIKHNELVLKRLKRYYSWIFGYICYCCCCCLKLINLTYKIKTKQNRDPCTSNTLRALNSEENRVGQQR